MKTQRTANAADRTKLKLVAKNETIGASMTQQGRFVDASNCTHWRGGSFISDASCLKQRVKLTSVTIQNTSVTSDFTVLVVAAHEHGAASTSNCDGPKLLIGLDIVVVTSGGGQLKVQVMVLRFVVLDKQVAAKQKCDRTVVQRKSSTRSSMRATYRNFEARTKREDMTGKISKAQFDDNQNRQT